MTGNYDLSWSPDYELRYMNFSFSGGWKTIMYHANYKLASGIRYTEFCDPDTGAGRAGYLHFSRCKSLTIPLNRTSSLGYFANRHLRRSFSSQTSRDISQMTVC